MRYVILVVCLGAMAVSCQLEEGEPAGEAEGYEGQEAPWYDDYYFHLTLEKTERTVADTEVYVRFIYAKEEEEIIAMYITELDSDGNPDPCLDEFSRLVSDPAGRVVGKRHKAMFRAKVKNGNMNLESLRMFKKGDDWGGNPFNNDNPLHSYSSISRLGRGAIHHTTASEDIRNAFSVSESLCDEEDS